MAQKIKVQDGRVIYQATDDSFDLDFAISGTLDVSKEVSVGPETSDGLITSHPGQSLVVSSDTGLTLNVNGVDALSVGSAGSILLNGSSGTSGQIFTSQGPSLPPIWTDAPSGGGSSTLERNVEIVSTSVGALSDGYVFTTGMTLTEVLEAICINVLHPTYVLPQLSIASTPSASGVEIGTISDIDFTETFSINDGGARSATRFRKNGTTVSTSMPYSDLSVTITDTPITYVEEVDYTQGACKVNNIGNIDCTGRVVAGTATSNTITFTGARKAFYGTLFTTTPPTTSADIRGLLSTFSIQENSSTTVPNFTITIPVGAELVVFAYPLAIRDVTAVRYTEFLDIDVKDNFSVSIINVEGADGYTAIPYKVYTYVPVEPYSIENNYKVFI